MCSAILLFVYVLNYNFSSYFTLFVRCDCFFRHLLRNIQECSDELLVGMDQQLKLLEDDCAAYRQLVDMLKEKYSNADVASMKQTLRNLQVSCMFFLIGLFCYI